MTDDLQRDMAGFYRELEYAMAPLRTVCNRCGDCCHFTAFDHQLWIASIELAYLVTVSGKRDMDDPGICPYMKDRQCTAREGRTLGCRIFHCRMDAATMEHLHETFLPKLRQLCENHDIEMDFREFTSAMQDPILSSGSSRNDP